MNYFQQQDEKYTYTYWEWPWNFSHYPQSTHWHCLIPYLNRTLVFSICFHFVQNIIPYILALLVGLNASYLATPRSNTFISSLHRCRVSKVDWIRFENTFFNILHDDACCRNLITCVALRVGLSDCIVLSLQVCRIMHDLTSYFDKNQMNIYLPFIGMLQ